VLVLLELLRATKPPHQTHIALVLVQLVKTRTHSHFILQQGGPFFLRNLLELARKGHAEGIVPRSPFGSGQQVLLCCDVETDRVAFSPLHSHSSLLLLILLIVFFSSSLALVPFLRSAQRNRHA
jgi:hypothetical protein